MKKKNTHLKATGERRNSLIITMDNVKKDLKPYVKKMIEVAVDEVLDEGGNTQLGIQKITGLLSLASGSWPNERLFNDWCEWCSADFFKANPDIDDVLVLVQDGDCKQCEWLASA